MVSCAPWSLSPIVFITTLISLCESAFSLRLLTIEVNAFLKKGDLGSSFATYLVRTLKRSIFHRFMKTRNTEICSILSARLLSCTLSASRKLTESFMSLMNASTNRSDRKRLEKSIKENKRATTLT